MVHLSFQIIETSVDHIDNRLLFLEAVIFKSVSSYIEFEETA